MISLDISVAIPQDTLVYLKLHNLTYLVSVNNGLLQNDTLYGELYDYDPYSSNQVLEAVKSRTQAAVQAVVGTLLAVSIINPNPTALWTMLNTLEILAYIGLSKIPMTNSFYTFVVSLNSINFIPNIFEYFLDDSDGIKSYPQAVKYGFGSNLFLLNAGEPMTTFLILILLLPIIMSLSNCSQLFIAKKLSELLKNYKYSVFLRFLVQAYLNIGVASIIGLLNSSFSSSIHMTNTVLCIFGITVTCMTPILFFLFTYKNLDKIQNKDKGFAKL